MSKISRGRLFTTEKSKFPSKKTRETTPLKAKAKIKPKRILKA
ncbi:MAG: hypothetical protein ACOZDD_06185 [Bacteroidota bacterium]